MAVATPEEGWTVRHQGIECLAPWGGIGKVGDRPSGAHDPVALRMPRGVVRDRAGELVRLQYVEVALHDRQLALHRMDVRVLESGKQRLAAQPDDARGGADQPLDLGSAADGHDPAARDGHRIRGRTGVRRDRLDGRSQEDEVSWRHARVLRRVTAA